MKVYNIYFSFIVQRLMQEFDNQKICLGDHSKTTIASMGRVKSLPNSVNLNAYYWKMKILFRLRDKNGIQISWKRGTSGNMGWLLILKFLKKTRPFFRTRQVNQLPISEILLVLKKRIRLFSWSVIDTIASVWILI